MTLVSPSGHSPLLLLEPLLLLLLLRIVPFRETSSKPLLLARLLNASSGVPRFEEVKNKTSRKKRICCFWCWVLLRIILSSPFFFSSSNSSPRSPTCPNATKESKECVSKRNDDASDLRQFFSSSLLCVQPKASRLRVLYLSSIPLCIICRVLNKTCA